MTAAISDLHTAYVDAAACSRHLQVEHQCAGCIRYDRHAFRAEGPSLHTHSIPQSVEKRSDGSLTLHLDNGENYIVDAMIWAVGRAPSTGNIGLENTGVKLDKKGYVIVDDQQNTTAKGIYCAGDCMAGGVELTPVAIKAGRTLSERLFNGMSAAKVDYNSHRGV
ncbi:FAD-dependent oxidoreductase [Nitrosomonas mobilis]|nr:FAD-dependent oxidoreductase [Nitrosomonas mobilis]